MTVHAYGDFEYNVWIPAYSHHYNKEKQEHIIQQAKGYEIRFLDSDDIRWSHTSCSFQHFPTINQKGQSIMSTMSTKT